MSNWGDQLSENPVSEGVTPAQLGHSSKAISKDQFFLGCAVWAYKDWLGSFYPPGSRSRDYLRLYSDRFNTVEGNTTFYNIPDQATIERWATETPAGFHFCPKLPRAITHGGSLLAARPAVQQFCQRMRGLGDRLGPLFAQFPPNYGPEQFADLAAFLQSWAATDLELAIEVRQPNWFKPKEADRLNQLLHCLGIGRVMLDTRPIYDCADDPQLKSERRKPRLPVAFVATSPFCLIRFISHPDRDFNRDFMASWIDPIQQWLQEKRRVYLFVHCPDESKSPDNARLFHQILTQAGLPLPPLPETWVPTTPTQLSLF